MIHFAKLGSNNVVEKIVTLKDSIAKDSNGIVQESIGAAYLNNMEAGTWKQTYKTGTLQGIANPRKNYAGIGYTYDASKNAFISPQGSNSWTLNETTCTWEPPSQSPNSSGNEKWIWDESSTSWIDDNA